MIHAFFASSLGVTVGVFERFFVCATILYGFDMGIVAVYDLYYANSGDWHRQVQMRCIGLRARFAMSGTDVP